MGALRADPPMPTASYKARPYIAFNESSIALWGTLTAAVRLGLARFAEVQIHQPLSGPPTAAPWFGTVALASNGELNYGLIHAIADALVEDWNSSGYDLELRGGNAGSGEGSFPQQTTMRYMWIDGVRVGVPNYTLFLAGGAFQTIDPFDGAPNNPGISATLRLEIAVTLPD